ncbi:DNA gyrase inhibitor YacG [Piscinibacter sakaiensis]|uniref:DNA gyrase inhibitor YacG n=1 Tax=Piscinibacter sakaiensis TaxID=1547922 RepID=UPI003AACB90D
MDKGIPVRIVTCPCCKGPSRYASDNPYRPFCSERCRKVDLGAWASERFRVGAEPAEGADDGADSPPQPPHH